jgi:hypothetical protein
MKFKGEFEGAPANGGISPGFSRSSGVWHPKCSLSGGEDLRILNEDAIPTSF